MKTAKKIAALLLAVSALALLPSCAGSADDTENEPNGAYSDLPKITLIGADSTGKGAAGEVFGKYIAQRVSELTDGRLTIDYHPNGELGGDTDLLRQMQSNDIQLVVCQTAPTVSFVPEMAVFDLPLVFSRYSGDTIDRALNGENPFREALSAAYENAGLHLLGFLQNATYRLTTAHRELSALDDFRGLQIRTMENNNHMAFWTAIGAEPTPLPWAEVYISLKNGTIDAQENAADTCVGASFQEVQEYLACTNHILYCNQVCISKEAFESLDVRYREALETAVRDAIDYMRPQLTEIDAQNKRLLTDAGMTLIEYDESFFEELLALERVQALYDDINENQIGGLGEKLVAELTK